MVLSIEAKQQAPGRWEVFTDCGRERSGVDVVEWARRGVELGAGEILLTSIDREGTRKGFDVALTRAIAPAVTVPVIASGGYGEPRTWARWSHARAGRRRRLGRRPALQAHRR